MEDPDVFFGLELDDAYIYCDVCGDIHEAEPDADEPGCQPSVWRAVWISTLAGEDVECSAPFREDTEHGMQTTDQEDCGDNGEAFATAWDATDR